MGLLYNYVWSGTCLRTMNYDLQLPQTGDVKCTHYTVYRSEMSTCKHHDSPANNSPFPGFGDKAIVTQDKVHLYHSTELPISFCQLFTFVESGNVSLHLLFKQLAAAIVRIASPKGRNSKTISIYFHSIGTLLDINYRLKTWIIAYETLLQ